LSLTLFSRRADATRTSVDRSPLSSAESHETLSVPFRRRYHDHVGVEEGRVIERVEYDS
jgi:hypothetical protein